MATLNAPVVPKFTLPPVVEPPKPTPPPPAAEVAVEERPNEAVGADDLLSALVAADDLLAGLADVGEMSVEAVSGAQIEQRLEVPAELASDTGANALAVAETPAARKAPLLPPVRKQFAAPSSAKPAASAEASAVVLAESVIQPRNKSAYTLFAEARRAELKEQKPEFQPSELTKILGAEWSALSQEAKAPFYAAAEAEKAVPLPVQHAKPAVKPAAPGALLCVKPAASSSKKAPPSTSVGGAAAEPNLKPRTISAYTAFCSERRAFLKAEQPDLEFGALSKALAAEWKALDEAERLPFVELAAERTAAAPLRLPKAPKASKAVKRAAPSSPDIDIEPETQDADIDVTPVTKKPTPPGATTGVVEWGMDRSKPVSFLVSRLMSGSYLAFRQDGGDGLTEEAAVANRSSSALYGDAAAGDSAELLLHTEEQELDVSMHFSQFKAALSQRSASGAIDLDDLEPDSPLVTMKTLHKLRFNGAPLDPATFKSKKNLILGVSDSLIKVPAVGLSYVVDRMISGAVQAALTAERARVAASAASAADPMATLSKALVASKPAALHGVAMEE